MLDRFSLRRHYGPKDRYRATSEKCQQATSRAEEMVARQKTATLRLMSPSVSPVPRCRSQDRRDDTFGLPAR
jgi:hypothetical protein